MLLRSITLKNILSFLDATLEVGPLNVLIGPNASGKSNLLEAISLLQAAPRDLASAIRTGGGVREWIWKGNRHEISELQLECLLVAPPGGLPMPPYGVLPLTATPPAPPWTQTEHPKPARYILRLGGIGQQFIVAEERLENESPDPGERNPYFYAQIRMGSGVLNVWPPSEMGRPQKRIERSEAGLFGSVLAERRDPYQFPEITYYAREFDSIRLYRNWNMGRGSGPRLPQAPDLPNDFLMENAENLVHVLNRMDKDGSIDKIVGYLQRFYDRFDRLIPNLESGTVQLFVREKGLSEAIPATWLSDGTLRLLYLMSVLCHPKPPPLVCIEEPELGMHPDALALIAEALVDASERTQLIVTTHSEALIDALSDQPEVVVVCRHDGEWGTLFQRLNKDALAEWLEEYTLGDLWRKGEIGGKR